jgi:hypothetical protein
MRAPCRFRRSAGAAVVMETTLPSPLAGAAPGRRRTSPVAHRPPHAIAAVLSARPGWAHDGSRQHVQPLAQRVGPSIVEHPLDAMVFALRPILLTATRAQQNCDGWAREDHISLTERPRIMVRIGGGLDASRAAPRRELGGEHLAGSTAKGSVVRTAIDAYPAPRPSRVTARFRQAVAFRVSGRRLERGACRSRSAFPCSGDVRRLRGRSRRDPHRLRPGR